MSATRDMSIDDMRAHSATIDVSYRYVDGYHVFTSNEVRGLYVASMDARKAYNDVAVLLKELVEQKVKASCMVEAVLPFEEWLATESEAVQTPSPEPSLTLGNKRYLVREAA